jgi:hypothetical protein
MPAELVPRFLDQLRPIVLEETAESWESWLRYLRDWVAENGAETLTRRLSGMPRNLRRWASKQRALGKRGQLTADRRAILEAVAGWTWDADDSAWAQCYRATEEFHAEHGRLPSNREDLHDGLKVGSWLMKQRAAARDGRLGEERLNLLSKLPGFSPTQRDDKFWRAHAAYLAWSTTKSEADLIRGPKTGESVQGVDLAQWVDNMRGRRRAKTARGTDIPQWQLDALAKLPGWAWSSVDTRRRADEFKRKVETVREYCRHHNVTARDITGQTIWLDEPIGRWINTWRSNRAKMSEERRHQVESLPQWSWQKDADNWEENLAALADFGRRRGHLTPSIKAPRESGEKKLGVWKRNNKNRIATLDPEQAHRLRALLRQYGEEV